MQLDFFDVRFHVECRQGQIFRSSYRRQQILFDRLLGDEDEDLHRLLLSHAVRPGDPLFENGWVPGKIDIDDRVRGLQVKTHGAGIGRQEHRTPGIILEAMYQFFTLLLRDVSIEPDELGPMFLKQRLDLIQHRRPFGEEHDFAAGFPEQFSEQLVQALQLAGIGRRLLVQKIGAIGRHAAHQEGFL